MNAPSRKHFPRWYIANDLSIVILNLISVSIGTTFIFLILRRKKLRTIFNILSSNSCLCGSLLALALIWDGFHMLKTDISGLPQQDATCMTRTICMLIAANGLHYSLCIQTYHRFISIVYCQQLSLRSMSLYIKLVCLQWILAPVLGLPLFLGDGMVYHTGSFVCQIPLSNGLLFTYLLVVSYAIPIIFIIFLHVCIARYIRKHWKFQRQRRLTGAYIICPLQRIILMILVFIVAGLPYGIFFILESSHTLVVGYAQKVSMALASLSFTLTMVITFGFNRSVRKSFILLFDRTEPSMITLQKSIK